MDSDFETTVGMERVSDPVSCLGGSKAFLDSVKTTKLSETQATTPPRHGILSVGDIDRLLSEGSTQSPEDTALLMRAMLLKDLAGENSHVKSRQPTNSEAIQKLLLQNGLNWVDESAPVMFPMMGGGQQDLIEVLKKFGYQTDRPAFSECVAELTKSKAESALGKALEKHFDSKIPELGQTNMTVAEVKLSPSFDAFTIAPAATLHRDGSPGIGDKSVDYLLSLHVIKDKHGLYDIELECPPDRQLSTQYIPNSQSFMLSLPEKNQAKIRNELQLDKKQLELAIRGIDTLWTSGTTLQLSILADKHCSSAELGAIFRQPRSLIHRSPSPQTIENAQVFMKENSVSLYRVLLLRRGGA